MARPKARPLTERELEVMQAFWELGEATVGEVREWLTDQGRPLAQTTVGTLVRIIQEKGFLEVVHEERPSRYRACRTFEEVSRHLLGDVLQRVFNGSRSQLLMQLFERRSLSGEERALLRSILREEEKRP